MPFARPTLAELERRRSADIAAHLDLGAILPGSVLEAFAKAQAGGDHLLHGHLQWNSRQFIPNEQTETAELERLGGLVKVFRKPAVGAKGLVAFTGSGSALVPAGTVLSRADGQEYQVDADTPLVAGAANVAVTGTVADGVSGASSNAAVGTPLQLAVALAGVNSSATVADQGGGLGLVNGFDLESDAQLLGRVLREWRKPRHGGAEGDYVGWALEVPGVTRAWVATPWPYANDVGVGFVLDGNSPSIFPDPTKVAEVQAYLEDLVRKPVTSVPHAFAPVEVDLDVTLSVVPNTSVVQAAVQIALASLLTREGQMSQAMPISKIRQAISNAPGVTDYSMTSPSANVTLAVGELLVPGTITFV